MANNAQKKQLSKLTTKYTDFISNNLTVTKFEDSKAADGQKMAFLQYNESSLYLQMPSCVLNDNGSGIPRLNEKSKKFFTTPKSRHFIKVPLDPENKEHKIFIDKMLELEEMMDSEEFRTKNFGKKANKYKFVKLIKYPILDEDDDENVNKNKAKFPHIKIKIESNYETDNIETIVYKLDANKNRTIVNDIVTIDDLVNVVRYKSTVRIIIRFVKMWAQAPTKPDPQYGITIKANKIELQQNDSDRTTLSSYKEQDTFLDSDDETNPLEIQHSNDDDNRLINNSDDDDDIKAPAINNKSAVISITNDSDEDEIIINKSDKKSAKKVIKNDDDESDNEVKKPVKKVVKKETKKEVNTDSDEDKPVIKQTKKSTKKPAKKVESDSESDNDIKFVKNKSNKSNNESNDDSD